MEAAVRTAEVRRGRWLVLAALGIAAAALLAAIVEISTEKAGPSVIKLQGIDDAQRIFGGLPQAGDRLGSSDAPVTIQVFNDVQCSQCDEQFLATVPGLVDEYVRPGLAQLLYRHYSFSTRPVQQGFIAAEAAGEQGYQWHYAYLLFRNQAEAERIGGVNDNLLDSIAASIGELDVAEWDAAFAAGGGADGEITERLRARDEAARGLGLRAEPSVIVSGPGGTEVLQDTPTLARIEEAVAALR